VSRTALRTSNSPQPEEVPDRAGMAFLKNIQVKLLQHREQ